MLTGIGGLGALLPGLLIGLVLGLLMGVGAVWLGMRARLREQGLRERRLAEAVRKLNHDIHGALSPPMLLAETLERHADPAVARAALTITSSLQRAAGLGTAAGALGRASGGESTGA